MKNKPATTRSMPLAAHLYLLITQTLFSTLPTFSKLAFRTFPPMAVALCRVAATTLIFTLLFRLFFFEKVQRRAHLLHFAVLAIFGVVGNQILFLKGLSFTTAVNATILITAIPVLTLLVAACLGQERLTWAKVLGIGVALGGIGLLLGFSRLQLGLYLKGNLLIVLNTAFYAVYLVIAKPVLKIYRSFTVITYVFLFGFFLNLPFTLSAFLSIRFRQIPPARYWPLAAVVVLGTILPYLFNTMGLKRGTSTMVAVYTYIQPLVGSLLAVLVLGEPLTLKLILSGVLILAGVALVSFSPAIVNALARNGRTI